MTAAAIDSINCFTSHCPPRPNQKYAQMQTVAGVLNHPTVMKTEDARNELEHQHQTPPIIQTMMSIITIQSQANDTSYIYLKVTIEMQFEGEEVPIL